MINTELFLRKFSGIENNFLDYIFKMGMNDKDDELDVFHQSSYFDNDDLINHIKNTQDKLIVLSVKLSESKCKNILNHY